MNDLTCVANTQLLANPFHFIDQAVRTAVDERGNVWVCAKDVFEALDITWSGSGTSLKNCPEKWQHTLYLTTTKGVKATVFLSEPGVYRVSFNSRKPKAVQFCDWVCEDVLPSIRRQGFYGKPKLTERVALSRQLTNLVQRIEHSRDAFARTLLLREVHEVCNLLGQPMPDLSLLGTDADQIRWPLSTEQ